MTGRLLRSFAPVGAAAALVLTAGCGDDSEGDTDADDSAPPLPTHTIAAQSYTRKPPVENEPENGDASDVAPGEVVEVEQEYTVESGDYMYQIAEMFEVSAEEIANYNRFEDGVNHQLRPGETIKIPPGAIRPGGLTSPTTTESLAGQDVVEAQDGDDDGSAGTSTQGAGDNCGEGTYTVEPNDYPIGVANKFDVTLDALNAANEDTAGYSAFYPGVQIVIPAKSDC